MRTRVPWLAALCLVLLLGGCSFADYGAHPMTERGEGYAYEPWILADANDVWLSNPASALFTQLGNIFVGGPAGVGLVPLVTLEYIVTRDAALYRALVAFHGYVGGFALGTPILALTWPWSVWGSDDGAPGDYGPSRSRGDDGHERDVERGLPHGEGTRR